MISIHSIDRALEQNDHDRLLRDLGRNGLVMPLPLRVQLAQTPAGALGLGLRRLVELTFGPTALSRQMIDGLVGLQTPAGAVVDDAGRPSCLLTAALAAGLGRVLRDHSDQLGSDRDAVQIGYARAIDALATLQSDDALFAAPEDRTAHDRVLTSAFIAYLLIDALEFATRCRGHALLSALEEKQDRCDPQASELIEMARLARLMPTASPEPVVAADHPFPLAA